jgi:D-sedoheptulose 7-phosphate isomerase
MSFLDALERHRRLFAELGALEAQVVAMADQIERSIRAGGKVVFFGNGGSAADSQHRPLPALALTVDTSILTAHSNDYAFETVFARQVEALCGPADTVIGISTSGNSANIIAGLAAAKSVGAAGWAWTGRGGGKLAETADHILAVPESETARVQEAHLFIGHWICEDMDRRFATS